MKKIINLIVLLVCLFCLLGCDNCEIKGHYEYIEVEVVDKTTATESRYNFFLDKYKIYTAYYLVLENGEVIECDIEKYSKYKIGDTYTISQYVSDEE